MRIVLDSNILLVAVGKRSPYRPIWQAFLDNRYALIVSDDILFEYEEILREHGAPQSDDIVLEILTKAQNALHIRIHYFWNAVPADPDDNKFFDAAVAANADYLVTNDGHFKSAKALAFPKVNTISADDFLKALEQIV